MPTIIRNGLVWVIEGDLVIAGKASHGGKASPLTEKPQYWDGDRWTIHIAGAKQFDSKRDADAYLAQHRERM